MNFLLELLLKVPKKEVVENPAKLIKHQQIQTCTSDNQPPAS